MKTLAALILLMFSFVAHAQMGGNGISGGPSSGVSLATSSPQSFNGRINAPQVGVGSRVLLNVGGNLAAQIASLDAAGGGVIMLSPGVFTSATQIALPDTGNCVNLEGSGKTRTTLQLTSAITTGFLSKGFNNNTQKCILRDITIDANGLAPQACQLIVGKGWQLENVRCINATTENLALGDFLGQNRANFTISSISRASGTVTVTLSTTPSVFGSYVLISGVADSSYNGTFKLLSAAGTTLTYTNAGSDGSSSGGTATLGQGGAGFYEVKAMGIDTDSTLPGFSTFASLPAYGVHLYPTVSDSDFFAIVSRNSQINIRNEGSATRFYGPHGYNFPTGSGFNATYTVEDTGARNEYYGLEGDTPQLAAIHITNSSTKLIGGLLVTDTVNYPTAQIAVIDSTASRYFLDGVGCSTPSLPSGNVITVPLGSGFVSDALSYIGFFPNCSGFYVSSRPNQFIYESPFSPGQLGAGLFPLHAYGDSRSAGDPRTVVSIQSVNIIAGDYLNVGLQSASSPLFRITAAGSIVQITTAPSGVCPTAGAWVFSQDGHATFCPSAGGTWATKI